MKHEPIVLTTGRPGYAFGAPGREVNRREGFRRRATTLAGVALAGSLAVLSVAAVPARADSGDDLRIGAGRLVDHGTEVREQPLQAGIASASVSLFTRGAGFPDEMAGLEECFRVDRHE